VCLFYIGIDGGGTGSRLVAVDKDFKTIALVEGRSTNIDANSLLFVRETLRDLFSRFFAASGLKVSDCCGLCIGGAGLDYDAASKQMRELILNLGFFCPCIAVNDSEIALAAATGGKSGAILISGTGSVCFGVTQNGERFKSGGWGHILSDGGSAYYIGIEAIKFAFKQHDGREPKDLLLAKMLEYFNVAQMPDALNGTYKMNKTQVAALAPIVFDCVKNGSLSAKKIVENAADELFYITGAVMKGFKNEQLTVYCTGGNILNNAELFKLTKNKIEAAFLNAKVETMDAMPHMGAARLAMKLKSAIAPEICKT
jgi:N-acetylglucosamine kinase-like BadF-type ATPase